MRFPLGKFESSQQDLADSWTELDQVERKRDQLRCSASIMFITAQGMKLGGPKGALAGSRSVPPLGKRKAALKSQRLSGADVVAAARRNQSLKVVDEYLIGAGEGTAAAPADGVEIESLGKFGRREGFVRGCLIASTVGLTSQLAFDSGSARLVAKADGEPEFQIQTTVSSCSAPAPAPPASDPEAEAGADGAAPPPPPPPPPPTNCLKPLIAVEVKESASGLKYKDVLVGDGEEPPIGYQVVVNYVVMLQDGKIISSTLEAGQPADVRVGAGGLVKGIDEGIMSMRSGGFRRLYVPGELSFQQRLGSAPGRPAVPAQSNLIVDVNLLYIPGLD